MLRALRALVLAGGLLFAGGVKAEIYTGIVKLTTTQAAPGDWFNFTYQYYGSSFLASSYHHVYLLDPQGNLEYYIDRIDLYVGGTGLRIPLSTTQYKSMRLPSGISTAGGRKIRIYSSLSAMAPHAGGGYHRYAESSNSMNVTGPPNLAPTVPNAWPEALVFSSAPGVISGQNTFTTSDDIYVGFAVGNYGMQAASTFDLRLLLNGSTQKEWRQFGLPSGQACSVTDYPMNLRSGMYTVSVKADCYNRISETSESDNTFSRTLSVVCAVNILPKIPNGWSAPLMLATTPGAADSSTVFYDTDPIYLSYAAYNEGTVASRLFKIDLYVDGVLFDRFETISKTPAGAYEMLRDYPLGRLPAGDHTIVVAIDANDELEETRETDNVQRMNITVVHDNAAPVISTIANQMVQVDDLTALISFQVSDAETAADLLGVVASSSNEALVPSTNIFVCGLGENRELEIMPVEHQLGHTTILLTVSDAEGLSASSSFEFEIEGSPEQVWRQRHFGHTANEGSAADAADPDDDGQNNQFEYVAGLDPRDPDSRFLQRIEWTSGPTGFAQIVYSPAFSNRTYEVLAAPSLLTTNWSALSASASTTNQLEQIVTDLQPAQTSRFYRVEITMQE